MMNFSAELKERQEYVNRVLDAFLPAAEGRQQTVLEAMRYICLCEPRRLLSFEIGKIQK